MKSLSRYLKPHLKYFIVGPAFKLLEAVLELFMPILMALIIDNGVVGGDTGYILKVGAVMLATATVGFVSAVICQYSAAAAALSFATGLRHDLYKKVLGFSGPQLDKFGTSTLFLRITNDVWQLQNAVNMTIRLVIRVPFICIGSVIAAMILDPVLGFLVLLALPLFSLCLFFIMKKSSTYYKKYQYKLDAIGAKVGENVEGVRVVRASSSEEYENKVFEQINNELRDTGTRVGKYAALLNPMTSLILNACIILIVWFGAVRINVGVLSSGQLIAFISYVSQMLVTLIVMANLVSIYLRAGASLGRVSEVLETAEDLNKFEEVTQEPTEGAAIEFIDVTFSYGGDGEPELSELSFYLPDGKSLGIIGATGSGKSTLLALLMGYYKPDSGSVLVDGKSVLAWDAKSLRNKVGYVPQKIELISGTVEENIRLNRQALSSNALQKAAGAARADEFITNMKKGYQSFVQRGGTNLSGGQKQRIAIARALYNSPELLILDDASSALDYATDSAVRKAIANQYDGITSIIVSQRVWAVKECDFILVLSDGKKAGFGTHKELFETCAEYREIVTSQDGGDEQ